MAIALRGVGTFLETQATTTVSVPLPTGGNAPQFGDLILVLLACGEDSPEPAVTSEPLGYVLRGSKLFRDYGAGGQTQWVYWKVAGASETNPQFTLNTGNSNGGGIWGASIVFSGTGNPDPFGAFVTAQEGPTTSTSSTYTPANVNTFFDGSAVISLVTTSDDNALGLLSGSEQGFTLSTISGASYDSTTGSDGALGVAYKLNVSGDTSVTMPTWEQTAVGPDYWAAQTIILKPTPASTREYAQAGASIILVISNIAQAQAEVGAAVTTYNVWAQTETWIKVTDIEGYAQAQASILAQYNASAQASVWLKSTYMGVSQADAYIKVEKINVFAQAAAYIRILDIEAYAQAGATVKVITNVWAQAEAYILGKVSVHAQAEAEILSSLATLNSFAQSQTAVSVSIDIYQYIDESTEIDTDYILTDYAPNLTTYTAALEQMNEPEYRQDHIVRYRAYKLGPNTGSLTVELLRAGNLVATRTQTLTDTPTTYEYALTPAEIESIPDYADMQLLFNGSAGQETRIYITWTEFQAPAGNAKIRRGFAQALATIQLGVSRWTYAQAMASVKTTYAQFAQALADILRTEVSQAQAQAQVRQQYLTFAQVQASVKNSYHAFAQAEAQIKQLYHSFANSAATVKSIYQSVAQAGALVKQQYNSYAQANASITQTYSVFGQAQAWLKVTDNVTFAQAQANIEQTYSQFAQANAYIYTINNVWAQAQAYLIAGINAYAQAQAHILTINNGYAQAAVWIAGSFVVTAQAQAKINAYAVQGYAQAQGHIRRTENRWSQAQASILKISFAQANAQGQIKQTSLSYAQAASAIRAQYYATAQAQAWIENTYQKVAQANAHIKAYGVQAYAQSTTWVAGSALVYAQAQAKLRGVTINSAQAQAQIKTTYQVVAQATASLRNTYKVYAQAQAYIKITQVVSAQAQATVLATTYQVGQTNTSILTAYLGYANAQVAIKTQVITVAQSGAIIQALGQSYAQAQASILASLNGYAQAQAYVLTEGLTQFAQAQASIVKAAAVAQALALIYQPVILHSLRVGDRMQLLLTVGDRENAGLNTDNKETITLTIGDYTSMMLVAGDRENKTLVLGDRNFDEG